MKFLGDDIDQRWAVMHQRRFQGIFEFGGIFYLSGLDAKSLSHAGMMGTVEVH